MAVPRRRITKRRQGNRRSQGHGKAQIKPKAVCTNCGTKVMPHKVCNLCGYYKGKQILVKFF